MTLTRRRMLTIAASAVALPRLALAAPLVTWRGHALGAHAEIVLAGVVLAEAQPLFAAVEAELDRLEAVFSLYRADSSLSQLNRTGALTPPPPEFLELLTLAGTIHARTGGVFDPTVQPLFALHAENPNPDASDIASARAMVGFDRMRLDPSFLQFDRPGMAMTLNGIAQGYATDRIRDLLAAAGLRDILVDIGEVAAIGPGPGGAGWTVRLPDGSSRLLRDRAVATSARSGTLVGKAGHIFRPDGADAGPYPNAVSVIAARAAVADGLSTALAVMSPAERDALTWPDCEIVTT